MKTNLESFSQFGKSQTHTKHLLETNYVVTLSRVSSKRQFNETLSIENQNKYFTDHAARTGKVIIARFGGTYESAKTDERKEFKRMLAFVKKNNVSSPKKISEIWVYMTDRFSRTGVGGMGVAEELREKYGVALFAIAQPTSVKDESGVFSQNMQFLMSNYENKIRRKRMIDGMTAKFAKGEWVTKVPMGYTVVKTGKERKIVINETGKKLRKAFLWKADGMKSEEIIERLTAMGIKMYKQQIAKIFKKPFYCGLVNHALLDGKIVQGTHEGLISPQVFLKVNEIVSKAGQTGVRRQKENEELPLKVFVKCEDCSQPFTGYVRTKKTKKKLHLFYYYKCRTKGCNCNKNAQILHTAFLSELEKFTVLPEYLPAIQYELENYYHETTSTHIEQEKALKEQLSAVEKRIENIEEKYYALSEMNRESFERFQKKYIDEKTGILKHLQECDFQISNLSENLNQVMLLSPKLATVWSSGDITMKEDFQKLVFPQGIFYNRKNNSFRTPEINFIFELIACCARVSGENEKGTNQSLFDLSPSAESARPISTRFAADLIKINNFLCKHGLTSLPRL